MQKLKMLVCVGALFIAMIIPLNQSSAILLTADCKMGGDINISIIKPYGHVYVFDREIAPIPTHSHRPFKAIVIGWVTVEVSVEGTVNEVDFYVDNVLKYNDTNPPYTWLWDENTHVPKHKLKVIAYGNGETTQDSVDVLYLNPFKHHHP